MDMTPQNIDLHIQELVLYGFDNPDSYYVRSAVERELARLFSERGVPSYLTRGRQVARLSGATFDVASGSEVDAIGSQVAQALYRGFSQ